MNCSNQQRASRRGSARQATAPPVLVSLDRAVGLAAAGFSSEHEAMSAICFSLLVGPGPGGICTLGDVFAELNIDHHSSALAYRVSQMGVDLYPGLGLIFPRQDGGGVPAIALTEFGADGLGVHSGVPVALVVSRAAFAPLFDAASQRPHRVAPRLYDDRLWFNHSGTQSTAPTLDETIEMAYGNGSEKHGNGSEKH